MGRINRRSSSNYQRLYDEKNKEKLNKYQRVYNEMNKEKPKENGRLYYEKNRGKNKEKKKEYDMLYYQNNREKRKEYYKRLSREKNKKKAKPPLRVPVLRVRHLEDELGLCRRIDGLPAKDWDLS